MLSTACLLASPTISSAGHCQKIESSSSICLSLPACLPACPSVCLFICLPDACRLCCCSPSPTHSPRTKSSYSQRRWRLQSKPLPKKCSLTHAIDSPPQATLKATRPAARSRARARPEAGRSKAAVTDSLDRWVPAP